MDLPLCPCGSKEPYEECCFLKKDENGNPLFYKGNCFSNDGKNWHPRPNVRLAATIVTIAADKYREYASKIASESKLTQEHHEKFINLYGIFYKSYDQLLESLKKTGGTGVAFETDSIESRKYWKDFLFNGRVLIHFLGKRARETLDLKREIGSLNDESYDNLLVALDEVKKLDIKIEIEKIKEKVLTFVNLRDKEKLFKDAIKTFPAIDIELGVIRDGKIFFNNKEFKMIKFIEDSYQAIEKLAVILLNKK